MCQVRAHLKNLPTWQLSALLGGHAVVSCHQQHSEVVCVRVTVWLLHASSLHVQSCMQLSRQEPAAQEAPAIREQLLQRSASTKPSWSHICTTGRTSTRKRGRQCPKSLQLETAGAFLAFEEGWSLGKRSGRIFRA